MTSVSPGRVGHSVLGHAWLLLVALVCGVFAGGARPARAADLTVEATVDRTSVPLDGQVVYTVSVSGGVRSVPDPELPDLSKDFTVYRGGSSHNFSFVNGQVSNTSTVSYILVPKHQGSVTIGRALVKANNATYQSQPINVTVTAPQGAAGRRAATPVEVPRRADPARRPARTGAARIARSSSRPPWTRRRRTSRNR